MRIAYVVHDFHRSGGHSRYVAELATRFSHDHDVSVFANYFEAPAGSRIRFHKVPAWRANALTTVLSFAAMIRGKIDSQFDIVHCQGFCGPRGNVITTHICNEAWHNALRDLSGKLTVRERIFDFFTTRLERDLYRHANSSRVIAISRLVADDVVRYYQCPAPIDVIPHGVDLETFSPENRGRLRVPYRKKLGFSNSEFVYLYVGDLRKGAQQCLLALLQMEHGRLMFVSRSDPAPYLTLAQEFGIADRTTFLPVTNRIEEAYAAADAFMLPSPYDTFGMVVTEAMASGLPVIVSRNAGASELIENGVSGLLIEDVSDIGELAAHMRSLSEDRAKSSSIGVAARKTVEQFSWQAICEKTLDVYRQAMQMS